MKVNYDLAKLFMLNTQLNKLEIENQLPYEFEIEPSFDTVYSQRDIKLQTDSESLGEFYETIYNRASAEELENRTPIDFYSFSKVIRYSYGRSSRDKMTVPSGGARYPISLYVVNFNIMYLEKGIYKYNNINNSLETIRSGDFRNDLLNATPFTELVDSCSFLIISVGDLEKTSSKYGNRGYNLMLMDLGHISQNIYLTSQKEKMGCRSIYGIYNQKLNELLNLNGINKNSLLMHVLGKEALSMTEYYALNNVDDYFE